VDDPQTTTKYTWQTIKRKRMRLTPEEATEDQFQFNTQNRFAELSDVEDDDIQTNDTNKPTTNNNQPREKKPPPIYKAALGQVFSEYFGFPCQSFHRFLNHHNHPGLTQEAY
jgi:hypothetical protein